MITGTSAKRPWAKRSAGQRSNCRPSTMGNSEPCGADCWKAEELTPCRHLSSCSSSPSSQPTLCAKSRLRPTFSAFGMNVHSPDTQRRRCEHAAQLERSVWQAVVFHPSRPSCRGTPWLPRRRGARPGSCAPAAAAPPCCRRPRTARRRAAATGRPRRPRRWRAPTAARAAGPGRRGSRRRSRRAPPCRARRGLPVGSGWSRPRRWTPPPAGSPGRGASPRRGSSRPAQRARVSLRWSTPRPSAAPLS